MQERTSNKGCIATLASLAVEKATRGRFSVEIVPVRHKYDPLTGIQEDEPTSIEGPGWHVKIVDLQGK